jgi:hypothetical protein
MNLFKVAGHAPEHPLAEIHQPMTVLPDFQRAFVWEPGVTRKLL